MYVQPSSSTLLKLSDLGINIPSGSCCNCGSTHDLTEIDTKLILTRYIFLCGTEYTLKSDLPYCDQCAVTANRIPLGFMHKLLVFLLWFGLIIGGLVIYEILTETILHIWNVKVFTIALSLSGGSTYFYYSLRKPQLGQTRFYQPVRLKKLKQKFSGEVTGLTLGFTSQGFANKFLEVNQEAVENNVLGIVSGGQV